VQRELDGEMGIVAAIEKLGLLDDILVAKQGSPLDTLSHYLSKRLAFGIINYSFLREIKFKFGFIQKRENGTWLFYAMRLWHVGRMVKGNLEESI
jgi:hypothetical protein